MSSNTRLGTFIVATLILFGVIVFLVGAKQFSFTRTYRVYAKFQTVSGLDEGAPVRAGGVRIGTVQQIDLPHRPGDQVTVQLALRRSSQDVIREDSVASVETEGLLGDKYMAVAFGTPDAKPIRDGDTIQSNPAIDYSDLVKHASDLLTNLDGASQDLKSIAGKVNGGDGTLGALLNDRSIYQNLNTTLSEANQTVSHANEGAASFQDDMEALKHNFLLRGFFKHRGYFDSSELTAHAINGLPKEAPMKQFIFASNDLFSKPDGSKLERGKLLNQVGSYLQNNSYSLAVVVSQTGTAGEKEKNLNLSEVRAMLVRQYLAQKFKIDDSRIRTMAQGEDKQMSNSAGRVAILVYPSIGNGKRTQSRAVSNHGG